MAVDDGGNSRIDFVWGNMPLQPNHNDDDSARWGMSPYPGDGYAEYWFTPEAALVRQAEDENISNQLQAIDSHVIGLRHWNDYPNNAENEGYTLTVDWWDVVPAYQYPNIVGLPVAEAVKQLAECGVNPGLLVDAKFDAPTQYEYIGYDGETYYNLVNAPGEDNPGVIFYRYYEPNDVIGTHWDGRPWYAHESEGMVLDTDYYPSEKVAVGEYEPNYFSYWHSFVVVNTTDPTKDSYQWWD